MRGAATLVSGRHNAKGLSVVFALALAGSCPASADEPGPLFRPRHDDLGWHGQPLGEVLYRCAGIARAVAISVRRTGEGAWADELKIVERDALAAAARIRTARGDCVAASIQARWMRALQLEGVAIVRRFAEGLPRSVAAPDIKLNVCRLVLDELAPALPMPPSTPICPSP